MTLHLHLEENKIGTDYIIGDLHGCYDTLQFALRRVGFNPEKDRLFSVGDLVDRGSQSEECAQLLAEPWFYAVIGNHEQMAIDCVDCPRYDQFCYHANGGQWFMDLPFSMQKHYADEFRKLPVAITIGNKYGIVHADPLFADWEKVAELLGSPDFTRDNFPLEYDNILNGFVWSRAKIQYRDQTVIENIGTVFCGHTPVKEPEMHGNVRYIDTGCVFGKSLTIATLDGTLTYKIQKVTEETHE